MLQNHPTNLQTKKSNVLSNFMLNHIHSYPLPQLHEAHGPIAEHHYMCVRNYAKILQSSLDKNQPF